ncbi:Uncharacterised protein [Bacillus freudenreichii]|nr:Uncharacterised protein [Bacillus freudenreichii]
MKEILQPFIYTLISAAAGSVFERIRGDAAEICA